MNEWPLYTTIKWLEEETPQGTKFGYVADLAVYYTDEEIERLHPLMPWEKEQLKEAVHDYALAHMETLKRLGTIDLDINRAHVYVTPRIPRNAVADSTKESE
jgi:hypothetical protein